MKIYNYFKNTSQEFPLKNRWNKKLFNWRINNVLSKFVACDSKKSKFIKEQKASGLYSSLRIKTFLNIILYKSSFVLEVSTS